MINDENTRNHFTSNMGFNRQWLGYKHQDMETLRMCHDQNTSSHTIIDLYGDGHPTVLRILYMGYLSTCDFRGVWPSLFPWSLWIMSEQGARRHGPSSDLYQPFPSLPKCLQKIGFSPSTSINQKLPTIVLAFWARGATIHQLISSLLER